VFEDKCRLALDAINIEGQKIDNLWKTVTAYDIGTKRWYDLFKENINNTVIANCFNMT
jgi:hypothetical protein